MINHFTSVSSTVYFEKSANYLTEQSKFVFILKNSVYVKKILFICICIQFVTHLFIYGTVQVSCIMSGWDHQVAGEVAGHYAGGCLLGLPHGGDQHQALRPCHVRGGDHLRQAWTLLRQRKSQDHGRPKSSAHRVITPRSTKHIRLSLSTKLERATYFWT